MNLQRRFDRRTARIGVVGLGYVGLLLAVEFAQAGFRVLGIDIDQRKVAAIGSGVSPVPTVPDEVLVPCLESTLLRVTGDVGCVQGLDAVIICVPTPLNADGSPDTGNLVAAARDVAAEISPQTLIVIESSMYPGGTRAEILPILDENLRTDEEVYLAISPERTDPGNPVHTLRHIPKLVAGLTPSCTDLASRLFRHVVDVVVPVGSLEIAEMSKLVENAFRFINISFVNEIAILCDRLELDVWQVLEAASTKPFAFLPHHPGPGIGGSCIPVLPMFLQWAAVREGMPNELIAAAERVNRIMPGFVVTKLGRVLQQRDKNLAGSRILLVGVSYKPDLPDMRNAPSLQILAQLHEQGADVRYHDPLVPTLSFNGNQISSSCLDGLKDYDGIILITPHDTLDYEAMVSSAVPILDVQNKLARFNAPNVIRL